MALTVKYLKEVLAKGWRDDAIITTQQGEDIVHISTTIDGDLILSTEKPIGTCNRTGANVYPSRIKGYSAYCPELDEDLFKHEYEPFES